MQSNKKLTGILILLAIVGAVAVSVHFKSSGNPAADLSRTSAAKLEPDAEKVLGFVMAAMEKADYDKFCSVMENRNAMQLETRYKDDLFAKGGLGSLKQTGEIRKVEKSSRPNWIVRVKSEKDGKEYYISLIRNKKNEIRVSGVSPVEMTKK